MAGKNDRGEAHHFDSAIETATDSQGALEPSMRTTPGDNRRIWQVALRDMLAQLERSEYDSWIKNLVLLEVEQGTALIAAPTSYARRRLESHYCEIISRSLSRVAGQNLDVQFIVEGPVQGQLFEHTATERPLMVAAGRPMPLPGIRSMGPSLDLEHNGNGNVSWLPQNRTATPGYSHSGPDYGPSRNGNGNGNGHYSNGNGKPRPQNDYATSRESYNAYAFPEEAAEIEDPVTGPPLGQINEQTGEYEVQTQKYGLNPRYLFDRYIVGSSNRMAYAAGRSVAENPGGSYNPLFIYGGVGLGKTHLLHAIGHEALRLRPYLKVLYVTSEQFTNDLINGIREQRMEEFRSRYRKIDLLMIDDIQFIAGKEQTQEEFFHTFNTLVEANKQVVISSDRPPKSMLVLSDRLRSRFEGGLISDISMPDYEMRLAILRAKADYQPGPPIPSDVLEFIAQKVISNIRELEGALVRVVAFSFLNKMPLTVELASQALSDSILNSRKKLVTKERIIEAVASFFNVESKELQGKSRSADIVLPRQIAMYIIREQTDHSLVEIGQSLGGRDHTTVMHGLDKIEQALDTNTQLRQQINTITQIIYNGESLR